MLEIWFRNFIKFIMPTINKIDHKKFYDYIRPELFKGTLSLKQVQGMDAIMDEWEERGLTDRRWLAYMLATTYHETSKTMQPIEEYGKGAGRPYGVKLKMGGGPGKRIKYSTPDKLYYGRGFVQLTWYENYELMGRLLGYDLLNHPEKALEMDVAVKIMFEGMMKAASSFGDFTGRSLEQYFNNKVSDPVGARKIINGTDKAELISVYYYVFLKALS
jgi:putative chitinase